MKNSKILAEGCQASLRFIYQDDYIFALDKPAGVHSVELPTSPSENCNSIAHILRSKHPELSQVSDKPEDSGLVNRLDLMTSGLLLGAKQKQVWQDLRKQLAAGKIEKSYLTLLEGNFPKKEVSIKNFLGSPNRRGKKVKIYEKKPLSRARALPAHSVFLGLGYMKTLNLSLVRVWVEKGLRHQIRAHAGWLKHPLLGDKLYGSKQSLPKIISDIGIEEFREFFLHAETLKLIHPVSGKKIFLKAEIPQWLKGNCHFMVFLEAL